MLELDGSVLKTVTHYIYIVVTTNYIRMLIFLYTRGIYVYVIEYLESLSVHIKDMKIIEYTDNIDVSDLTNTYIFLQDAPQTYLNSKNVYLLNIEQLTRVDQFVRIINSGHNLCDYSRGNIQLLKNVPSHYLPYQYNVKEIKNIEKTNDVIFTGYLSEHRNEILKQIPNVNIIQSGFGEERDAVLFSHKILVNVHCVPDYNIHEQIRTTRCIFNKMIVITEKSLDDECNIMKDFMIITERENIPAMVEHVLNNYEMYYNKLFANSFDDVIAKLREPVEQFLTIT